MKLLCKLSTKKTRFPILNTILVKDGMAWGTDMDCYISHPCDKPDGLYDAHKAKIGIWQTATDMVTEDFPAIPNELTNMVFSAHDSPVESLKWVSKAMSKESSQYYLCGVLFDTQYLVATNGFILKRIEQSGPLEPFIMPDFMAEAIIASGANKYSVCFNGKYIFAHAGDYTIVSKAIDGRYPDYTRAIPTDRDTGIPFNTEPFKDVLKRTKELDKAVNSNLRWIKLSAGGMVEYASNNDITESFGKLVTTLPYDIYFNCELLAHGEINGLAYFGQDQRDPLVIFDDNKTFVVVPLKL